MGGGGGGGGGGGSESEVGMLMTTALPQAQESRTQPPNFPGVLQGVSKMWEQSLGLGVRRLPCASGSHKPCDSREALTCEMRVLDSQTDLVNVAH